MARLKRTKRGQKAHDEKLRQRVKVDKKPGITVLADLPDMKRPPKLRGYIPDKVVKHKGKIVKIEEIETPKTLKKDKAQQRAFRKAAKKKGATFKIILAKEKRRKRG